MAVNHLERLRPLTEKGMSTLPPPFAANQAPQEGPVETPEGDLALQRG